MNRRRQRELTFFFLFENTFNGYTLDEIRECKLSLEELKDEDFTPFIFSSFNGVIANIPLIDQIIEKNSVKWGKGRLSRSAISILRLAVYEMIYDDNIPNSVAINEAVELSKKYGSEKESSFVNGVLGNIDKGLAIKNV